MIGLVDGNNFFVSCERLFDPSLHGRAVGVLSNNDGCVISRSNELKALNVAMGVPYFQLKPLIGRHGLILKSSNYELYGDISRRMIAVLHEFSADVEQYSIDEAFVHVKLPKGGNYSVLGETMRETILKWIGIPCGIGFATTKTLAKIANHIAKRRVSGVFVMPDDPKPVLEGLAVSEVWGVGRCLAPRLEKSGISTAWQLSVAEESWLKRNFSIVVVRIARELRGEPVVGSELEDEPSQSIACSRSFGRPVVELAELTEAVAHYTARAAEKLRREKQRASGVNVYFQYYPEYKPLRLAGGCTARTIIFSRPLAAHAAMLKEVIPKLEGIFIAGRRYKKAGVVFFGLESNASRQLDLFADQHGDDRQERLSAVVDNINRRFGKGTLFNLGEGIARSWAMRRDLLSSYSTTDWNLLPVVKCR